MRIFYASDIHGSERCWRKFLNAAKFYSADALVLGADLTGKAIVPLVEGPDAVVRATFLGSEHVLEDAEAVAALERRIADTGYYSHRCTAEEQAALREDPEAMHELFVRRIVERLEQWMALADERLGESRVPCYVNAGNDDPPEVDAVIEAAERVEFLEGRVVLAAQRHGARELRLRQSHAVALSAGRPRGGPRRAPGGRGRPGGGSCLVDVQLPLPAL